MKKYKVWILEIFWLGSLIFCLANPVMANGPPPLSLATDAETILITGILDGQRTSFSGRTVLTVAGGDVNALHPLGLRSSDLQHEGDPRVSIPGMDVQIPEGTALSKDIPLPVVVTVQNVKRPGKYNGTLIFFLKQHQAEAHAAISLDIDEKPVVNPIYSSYLFRLISGKSYCGGLVSFLTHKKMLEEDWPLDMDNLTLLPVRVTGAAVVMRGEKSGYSLSDREVEVKDPPCTLPARQAGQVILHIKRSELEPDSYQGSIRLKLDKSDDPVLVNATIEVRNGPLLPLLILLLGIIVGRLAVETPTRKMQYRLLHHYYQLVAEANNVKDPVYKDILTKSLKEAFRQIDLARKTELELTQMLDEIETLIDLMVNWEELKRRVDNLSDTNPNKLTLQKLLGLAHDFIKDGNLADAKTQIDNVEKILAGAGLTIPGVSKLKRGLDRLEEIKTARATPPRWLPKLLAWVCGGPLFSLKLRYWLVRPLLFILLLVILGLVGLKTLYIDAGSTFGAAGIYDYLGLFLWGLSSDVVQTTLQTIPRLSQGTA